MGQPAGLTTIADQGMFIATTARVLDLALVTAGERLMGTEDLRALSTTDRAPGRHARHSWQSIAIFSPGAGGRLAALSADSRGEPRLG